MYNKTNEIDSDDIFDIIEELFIYILGNFEKFIMSFNLITYIFRIFVQLIIAQLIIAGN